SGSGRSILFCGHYAVRRAGPRGRGGGRPCEPTIRPAQGGVGEVGERVVARGAVDDKGQVATFLEAVRAWSEASGTPAGGARITVLLEGEEESGSVNLERYLEQRAELFRGCDVCVISDTGLLGRGRPAVADGLRRAAS